MNAAIERIRPGQEFSALPLQEVACIFCGLPTPLPARGRNGFASHVPRRISIVRCLVCGKEAPYRTCDTFEVGEMCCRQAS
jgi:hypothetical protein